MQQNPAQLPITISPQDYSQNSKCNKINMYMNYFTWETSDQTDGLIITTGVNLCTRKLLLKNNIFTLIKAESHIIYTKFFKIWAILCTSITTGARFCNENSWHLNQNGCTDLLQEHLYEGNSWHENEFIYISYQTGYHTYMLTLINEWSYLHNVYTLKRLDEQWYLIKIVRLFDYFILPGVHNVPRNPGFIQQCAKHQVVKFDIYLNDRP